MAAPAVAFILLASFLCCADSSYIPSDEGYHDREIQTQDDSILEKSKLKSFLHAKIGSQVCMTDLGCFVITKDFFSALYRPINLLPQDRVTINTKFQLYTKDYPKEAHDILAIDLREVDNIEMDPNILTIFIVHGYLDNKLYGKWIENLKDNLLLRGNYNVFIVDWSGGNALPYTQATANTRVVGAEIANLITVLQKKKGLSPMKCHIIGHSLGSHIAGYAGERLQKLGRISGVDPAEPYFQNMPPSVRLDSTDADFVDVIHTDSKSILLLGLGMDQAIGHVDFYPNEGKNQPGCRTEPIRSIFMEGLIDATRQFAACNHQRAVEFFIHSVNYKKVLPVGYLCPSWKDYTNGRCADCGSDGSKCAVMGMLADQYKPLKDDSKVQRFYLTTSGKAPYWLYHYQVNIKLNKPKSGATDQKGKLTLILNGAKGSLETQVTNKAIDLYHGSTYAYLITTEKEIGSVKSVSFKWESSSFSIFSTPQIYLEKVKVVPMNIIDKDERKKEEKTFCDKPDVAIKSKAVVSLTKTDCK